MSLLFRDRGLPWIKRAEGGWFNHPSDPGGATYGGISQRAAASIDLNRDGVLDFDFDGDGDVDLADMKELRRRVEAGEPGALQLFEDFYRERYWQPVRADELAWPVGLVMFDSAVNSGVGAAVLQLQKALRVDADGKMGPRTLGAAAARGARVLDDLMRERVRFYRRLSEARFRKARARGLGLDESLAEGYVFLDGWLMRLILLTRETAQE